LSAGEVAGTLAIGFAAGMASGMLGIGGGLLFVPGLVLILGESQLRCCCTSPTRLRGERSRRRAERAVCACRR
jgi:hypothetical protein